MDTHLQPLFEYLDGMKSELKEEIKEVKEDVRSLRTAVDTMAKRVDDVEKEQIILNYRVSIVENKVL